MMVERTIYPRVSLYSSQGTSAIARYVSSEADRLRSSLRESIVFGMGLQKSREELRLLFEECGVEDWDGYRAEPVKSETYELAMQFLNALPLGSTAPSVGAEPDGHITFEWYRSPRRTLSVSIAPHGSLYYAALLGAATVHGSEPFFGEIPESLINLMNRTLSS